MTRSLPHYREFRRFAAPSQVAQQLLPKTVPAPTRGLILNENPAFMQPAAALVLDNWFVTENTIKLRGGTQTWCSLPEAVPVRSLFNYVTGTVRKLFASNANKLYDVTGATAVNVTGITITDGNFSTAQMANAGGYWLIACNDSGNYVLRFDGVNWVQLTDTYVPAAGMPGKITAHPPGDPAGTQTTKLSLTQVWKYRRRLFFIQGSTMDAWYLDIDAVGGALKQIPLSGAFTKGGSLLFGCAWSVSAGDGIDDKCIFVTTEGEIAVFTGTNPGDAQNWKQQGRYQMSPTMGKNSWLNIGGDVLIITADGLVPLSQTLTKDITALEFSALTRSIHPAWDAEILDKNDRPWSMCKWDEYGALFVTLPGGLAGDWRCFVANTVTGAWSRFTGWDALQFCTLSSNMYFGTQDGRVVQADVLGKDYSLTRPPDMPPSASDPAWQLSHLYNVLGARVRDTVDGSVWKVAVSHTSPATGTFAAARAASPTFWTAISVEGDGAYPKRTYTGVYVNGWEVFGSPPNQFTLRQARCSFSTRASEEFILYMACSVNYQIYIPPPPPAGAGIRPAEVWDEGLWGGGVTPPPVPPTSEPNEPGRARWDQPGLSVPPARTTEWVSIGETGWSHAPTVMVSVFQDVRPDVELLGISMLAEKAGVAV
jgi:hypothetical protein